MLPSALNYLGLDPNSESDDLKKAAELLMSIRPYIRYFHSSQYIDDLGNGEICVSVGYSGDVFIAADRAAEAGTGVEIAYAIPKEGALQWFDLFAIPADAPHPDNAHKFIDFIMSREITAAITNYVFYATANSGVDALIDPEIDDDPAIYPTAEVSAKLFPPVTHDARTDRMITRLWTQSRPGSNAHRERRLRRGAAAAQASRAALGRRAFGPDGIDGLWARSRAHPPVGGAPRRLAGFR